MTRLRSALYQSWANAADRARVQTVAGAVLLAVALIGVLYLDTGRIGPQDRTVVWLQTEEVPAP